MATGLRKRILVQERINIYKQNGLKTPSFRLKPCRNNGILIVPVLIDI
jgi:hypothetical protein